MASLQRRNGTCRLLFQHDGEQHTLNIGDVGNAEAIQWKGKVEHLLMRLKQRMLEQPAGCTIQEFLLHDGRPPSKQISSKAKNTTLGKLHEVYVKAFSNGGIEPTTLATAEIHFNHLFRTYGKTLPLAPLSTSQLQDHVDRRQKTVSGTTAKKEISTFRAAWNWGTTHGHTAGIFPSRGLVYAKTNERLPFMSWDEITQRIAAGGDADQLWDCLYLNTAEVEEFLEFAKGRNARQYLYPMLVMNAHTGARRSEALRSRREDVDFTNLFLTLREKTRARGKFTTRRVPISGLLATTLKKQWAHQDGRIYLFGDGDSELTDGQVDKAFKQLVKDSKWQVLKGYHILRHAFISALASKGVDQRIIDEFAGHSTEEQRRRYRHLFPQVTRDAIANVFG